MVPPYTRGNVSLSRGPGRKPGASLYTRKRLSLTGTRANAWCLLIHAEAPLSHGGQGESLVPPITRGSISISHGGQGINLRRPTLSLDMSTSKRMPATYG